MTLKPALSHTRLTGWLLDVYPDRTGMAVWFLDDEGRRFRLLDPRLLDPPLCQPMHSRVRINRRDLADPGGKVGQVQPCAKADFKYIAECVGK